MRGFEHLARSRKRPTTSCQSTPNIRSANTTCYQKKGCDSMEGLCNLLRRQAYPGTYCDMVLRSGLSVSAWFSNTQLTFSNDTHGHSFTPQHPTVVRPFDLQAYSYKGGQLYKTILVSQMVMFAPYAGQETTEDTFKWT